jgi:hypothetical protein
MGEVLLTIRRMAKVRFFATFVAMVFVASRKRSVHAWLPSVLDLGYG